MPWEQAGALFIAGTTAYAAVHAVRAGRGETVVVSGAAGGVGSLVVQLARHAGATVLGLASEPHHAWLTRHGAIPLTYGEGVGERIRAAADGSIDFAGAAKHGTKADGCAEAASADVLRELATLIADGDLEIPIARVHRLDEVRDAFRELERRHTNGKIVLRP
ncbi:zinc-binding dehydrogenase [Streptomyces sp. NPDC050619]|uniref:zinc-binding dehydrogenase n=1 Tax=Streptomyces sp. NPDC050619 TaxID=3157214 RepID=UPI00342A4A7D